MTEQDELPNPDEPSDTEAEAPAPAEDDDAEVESIRQLLRGASSQARPPAVDVLRGVQSKIRERSRGKYFDDGWSTTRQPPISTFLVTSLVMLAIGVFVYLVLTPLRGDAVRVAPPPPVNVVPAPGQR
jgi:hypothetical protein